MQPSPTNLNTFPKQTKSAAAIELEQKIQAVKNQESEKMRAKTAEETEKAENQAEKDARVAQGSQIINKIEDHKNPTTGVKEGGVDADTSNTVSTDTLEKDRAEEINEKKKEIENVLEISADAEKIPEADKEKIGWGLSTIGFKVERAKNKMWAATFSRASKLLNLNPDGTAGKFCKEMENSFVRDAESAEKKALDPSAFNDSKILKMNVSGSTQKTLSNIGLFTGNILKYGRIIADATGASIANPFRYVMMGGMVTARASEAGKEVRLQSEELMEKTRVQDIEAAAQEAYAIYERARAKEGKEGNENVSVESLKNAYLMEMPKDIQRRLENTSDANSFVQNVLKKDIEIGIARLNTQIQNIEDADELSEKQKELVKEKLILQQKKKLEEYDRMVTQYGTVDEIAMALRYSQKIGKMIVLGMQIETIVVSVEKLWGGLSHVLSSHGASSAHMVLSPKEQAEVDKILKPWENHTPQEVQPHVTPPTPDATARGHTPPVDHKVIHKIKIHKTEVPVEQTRTPDGLVKTDTDGEGIVQYNPETGAPMGAPTGEHAIEQYDPETGLPLTNGEGILQHTGETGAPSTTTLTDQSLIQNDPETGLPLTTSTQTDGLIQYDPETGLPITTPVDHSLLDSHTGENHIQPPTDHVEHTASATIAPRHIPSSLEELRHPDALSIDPANDPYNFETLNEARHTLGGSNLIIEKPESGATLGGVDYTHWNYASDKFFNEHPEIKFESFAQYRQETELQQLFGPSKIVEDPGGIHYDQALDKKVAVPPSRTLTMGYFRDTPSWSTVEKIPAKFFFDFKHSVSLDPSKVSPADIEMLTKAGVLDGDMNFVHQGELTRLSDAYAKLDPLNARAHGNENIAHLIRRWTRDLHQTKDGGLYMVKPGADLSHASQVAERTQQGYAESGSSGLISPVRNIYRGSFWQINTTNNAVRGLMNDVRIDNGFTTYVGWGR